MRSFGFNPLQSGQVFLMSDVLRINGPASLVSIPYNRVKCF